MKKILFRTDACNLKRLYLSCKSKQNTVIKNGFTDFIPRF